MDLNYVNKKLCEGIFNDNNDINSTENKVFSISMYEGYDIYLFLDNLLSELKSIKILGNIYMINFSDYFIKLMNNNYNNEIDNITNKNKNDIGKIFSVTDRVFLKDIISREIFLSQISAIIFSPTTYFDISEKIWCIHKFLEEEGKNILFFYLLQNQKHYNFFLNSLNKSLKITKTNFKHFILSRNNILIEKIINRKFQLNKISLIEVNISDNNDDKIPVVKKDIKKLLEQLLKMIYEEIIKNIGQQENNSILNKLLSEFYDYRTINHDDSINNIHFKLINILNEKSTKNNKYLYYDLLSIKYLLKKCESYDIASLYNIFKEIKLFSEKENSIFSYQDSNTENLIYELCNKFKNNLYNIKSDEKRIITEEENTILDEFFELYVFINMTPELKLDLRKILEQNIIELKCDNDFFKINYNKYIQLINILESKMINNNFDAKENNIEIEENKKEQVLIITNNECEIDNFKSIFNIYGLNKTLSNNDKNFFTKKEYLSNNKNIYKEFFEYNLRRFLINKREFLTRYKIISSIKNAKNISNYCKENLFLHYLCYQLTRSFDIKNEGLFDRIYDMYQKNNNEIDLLPSEFAEELTEDIFNDYIQQNFNEEETFPFIKIDYISLNMKEYYKKEINLIEKLRNKNYSKIILFDYNTILLRTIECFITNYNQTINTIVLFLDYNSYNFKIDFNQIKLESNKFKNTIPNPKEQNEDLYKKKEHISTEAEKDEKYNILIDFREMGTKTPYYLYKNNFTIINGPLEVGDYILTNNYCIERKSISTKDFYQSLNNSKHLIEQTIKMGKYYKNIILLLEFEETIDIINNFESGICYNKIIMRKLLDLTNITELEKNNFLFIWSLNCKMTSKLLRNLRIKLKKEILDIDYCLNINKITKGNISKNQKKKEISINSQNESNINYSNSQKNKTIESFFHINQEIKENKEDENNKEKDIEKYETQNNNASYINEIMNKKLDISAEKIIRNIPGINGNNYNLITDNFNNLYDFITCKKEKKFELFGRINGTRIFSLFNYEYQ